MSNIKFDGQVFNSLKEVEAYKNLMSTLGLETDDAIDEEMVLESLESDSEDDNSLSLEASSFERFEHESFDYDYECENELVF